MGPRHGVQSCPLSMWVSHRVLHLSKEGRIQALPSGFLVEGFFVLRPETGSLSRKLQVVLLPSGGGAF